MEQQEKMNASAVWEDEKLVIRINDEIVRSLVPNNQKPYKFNYQGEEFHFIYEKTSQTERVFFYPLHDYEERVINLKDNETT